MRARQAQALRDRVQRLGLGSPPGRAARLGRAPRLGLALALAVAIGFVPALAPVGAEAAAARPSLTIIGAATYDVLPDEGRVAVTVQLTATNHLKDTITRRFFFKSSYLTVLPGTSDFRVIGASSKAKVTVSEATDTYTNLKIDFGANLAAGKSTTLTLEFNIRDRGGAPDRALRISPSLVSFAAWAIATPSTPGASVDVRFPNGYSVTVRRGPLEGPTQDGAGHRLWSSGTLDTPLEFIADLAADRSSDYAETSRTVAMEAGPAIVLLRAWPDDTAWRDRVGALAERALPILEREIGVPWPIDGPLAVQEALVRGTGGYASLFDLAERRIEIGYAAPDGVILHELAHAWFNGSLVADRWVAEAFAAYYAEVAARQLGLDPGSTPLPAEPSDAAIPLNAWGPSASEAPDTETWAYAASLELAREIARRAGPEGLRAVWSKATRGIGAYQPDPAAQEPAAGPPDWRGLLDLLETDTETDADTDADTDAGEEFVDLWRRWVARPDDMAALADRAATRGYYLRSVRLAGDWQLPPVTRQAMRAWRFDVARTLLLAGDEVQAQRVKLEAAAAAAGATLPATLRRTFEGDGGLAAAAAEAEAEQATVDAISFAQAAEPTERGFGERLIIGVGLMLADPEAQLSDAQTALAAGNLETAYAAAQSAQTAWLAAAQTGRSRIVTTVLLLVALVLFGNLVRRQLQAAAAAPG